MEKATEKNKLVFVDLYTTWCGPCKTMSNDIFPRKTVGDFFNGQFINYKLDAEKGEGPGIAKNYDVSAYPTFVFVTGEGKLIYKFMGVRDSVHLIEEARKALALFESLPLLTEYESRYAQGERELSFLENYDQLLKQNGSGGGEVLNELLKRLPDSILFSEKRAADIARISVPDLPLYHRMVTYITNLDKEADKKIYTRLNSSLMKSLSTVIRSSISEKQEDVFEELLSVKKALGEEENAFSAMMGGGMAYLPAEQLRMNFYISSAQNEKFRKTLKEYMNKLQEAVSIDSLRREEIMYDNMIRAAKDSALAKNDSTALKSAQRMKGMMNMFVGLNYKLRSSFIVQAVGHYRKISLQDPAFKADIIPWIRYAYHLDRSLSTAWNCADLLESVEEKEMAREMLEEALTLAGKEDAENVEEADLEKVRSRLAEE